MQLAGEGLLVVEGTEEEQGLLVVEGTEEAQVEVVEGTEGVQVEAVEAVEALVQAWVRDEQVVAKVEDTGGMGRNFRIQSIDC